MTNFLNRICATALIVAATGSSALAQGAEGTWVTGRTASCSSPGDGGWVKIDRQGIYFYETSCKFGRTAPAGFPGLKGTLTCTGEGMDWASEVSFSARGDKLTMEGEYGPNVYLRCGAGRAEAAPSDYAPSGTGAEAAALLLGAILYKELRD